MDEIGVPSPGQLLDTADSEELDSQLLLEAGTEDLLLQGRGLGARNT